MEVEVEEVANLLFPDGIQENWIDSDEFPDYIVQLASCGVEKLGKESAHIREERNAILDQTKDLAYSNYKTFIHTAECSKTIYHDFTSVEKHLEGLSSCLPNLRTRVESFLATAKSLAQSRHLTSLTLSKHTQLLEVLELPQLMDTCVRNGYYEEALEIVAYVRRLEKKHTDIPIIAGIVKEVQAGTRLMLGQLLAQLRSPLALPQCLKVIGLLRRLDVFTEPELRLKFLQARDSWFNGILKTIPRDDAYQHIVKVVEASRVHLFDIVTQYRAIFSDDDSRFGIGDAEVNEQAIFHGWMLHKVKQLLRVVEKDLQRGVGANLEPVLAQCMFFGQSFSRIGADFRNLLIPIFQKAALLQLEKDVRAANVKFDETLSCFSLMEARELTTSSTLLPETQDKTRPPLTLMEFGPLAHYLNGLVAAFNTLRQCCPLATLPHTLTLLQHSLTKVISALLELHRLESSGFTSRESASFQRMCSVLAHDLLPHINRCLRLLYPLQQISLITGVPVSQLQKEMCGQLNTEELLAPIQHLLPTKEEEEKEEGTSQPFLLQDIMSNGTTPDATTTAAASTGGKVLEGKTPLESITEVPSDNSIDQNETNNNAERDSTNTEEAPTAEASVQNRQESDSETKEEDSHPDVVESSVLGEKSSDPIPPPPPTSIVSLESIPLTDSLLSLDPQEDTADEAEGQKYMFY